MNRYLDPETTGRAFQLFYSYLNSSIATSEEGQEALAGFVLDISNPKSSRKMGLGATSLALSVYSLVPGTDERHVREMERYVLSKQLPNGSWTISALAQHDVSLVYTTCYALTALVRSNRQQHFESIRRGIDWLTRCANDDGGWGLVGASPSHVHSTAEVLFLLSLLNWPADSSLVLRARAWLLSTRVDKTHWMGDGGVPSLYLTALAYRGLVVSGDMRYELAPTREWLMRQRHRAPCVETFTYYLAVGDHHVIEPLSCYTQSVLFEALSSSPLLEHEPQIENEARRYLKRQNPLGYWQCDPTATQVPMFLNYHISIGLVNYLRYLERRPKWALWHDVRAFWALEPAILAVTLLLALVGLSSLTYSIFLFGSSIRQITESVLTYFEDLTGLANFFQISGVSLVAVVALVIRLILGRQR